MGKFRCGVNTFVEALQHWRYHLVDLGENISACFGNHWRIGHNCHLRIAVKGSGLIEKRIWDIMQCGQIIVMSCLIGLMGITQYSILLL